jgi:hypothetical protein
VDHVYLPADYAFFPTGIGLQLLKETGQWAKLFC